MPEVKESKRLQAKRAEAAARQKTPTKKTPIQILQEKIRELKSSGNADPAVIAVLQARLDDLQNPAAGLAQKEIAGKKKLAKSLGAQ